MDWIDWLVDGEGKRITGYEIQIFRAWLHIETAIYCHWNDWQLKFVGKEKSASLETCHVSGECTCSFWEENHRHSVLQKFACCVVSLLNLSWRALVNRNVATSTTTSTKEWNLEQLVFHKPLEILVQITIYEENIKSALMVAYEYIAFIIIYVLSTFHLYWKEQ